jgi:hypothetical protein
MRPEVLDEPPTAARVMAPRTLAFSRVAPAPRARRNAERRARKEGPELDKRAPGSMLRLEPAGGAGEDLAEGTTRRRGRRTAKG